MSKIEIVNAYERFSEKDNKFYRELESLNIRSMNYVDLYYTYDFSNIIGFEAYGDKIIIPDGLFPVGSRQTSYVYLADEENVLYKISYYPGMNKNQEEFETSVVSKLPFNKIVTEKEFILEKACILTEQKHGSKNINHLKHAIESALVGNYSFITNEDNSRTKVRTKVKDDIISCIYQTIIKNDDYKDLVDKSTQEEIIDMYVDYVKEKLKIENKNFGMVFLADFMRER